MEASDRRLSGILVWGLGRLEVEFIKPFRRASTNGPSSEIYASILLFCLLLRAKPVQEVDQVEGVMLSIRNNFRRHLKWLLSAKVISE